ncbi:MAG: 1-deoxy-D-xylulose-5-phosphate reductoisomerase [Ruminiclostridium sp.]|nr:1-deoxy-D-xylulose-5-phosphate reductoisomerase [Ruminiclostridium sp.]
MSIPRNVTLLGSTGSIGTQTLDVCRKHNIKVKALTANKSGKLLCEQAREFCPEYVCVTDPSCYDYVKTELADTDIKILCGMEGLCEVASVKVDMVVNAVVGMVGLRPTLAALESGNQVALANKETLVTGGELVMKKAAEKNLPIIPIDSEHSAIFQSLMGNEKNKIDKILLTASGGPFYGYSYEQLKKVTKEQALKHPNWAMGQKITIDSATLMNKGLELIEAVWLFDTASDDIEILVHRQSILHSAVQYADGSIIGQLGVPDMKIPIQLALTYPERFDCDVKRLSLADVGTLTFAKADEETFLCLACAKKAITRKGTACTVLNSANETAVELFLKDKIPFYRIGELVSEALSNVKPYDTVTLETVLETEKAAREYVLSKVI